MNLMGSFGMCRIALRQRLFSAVVLLVPVVAGADGKTWAGPASSLRPVLQDEQMAAIVHRDGVQKMIIAVNFRTEDKESALWVIPVRGSPGETRLDIVDEFPSFYGDDLRREAAWTLGILMTLVRVTQLYPLLIDVPSYFLKLAGVAVHEGVEKWGIRVEAVTADSADSLTGYLRSQGVEIPDGELGSFEPYFSDGYVFVVAWIASKEQLLKEFPEYKDLGPGAGRWPCIRVEFPTDRAFYPLRPTSGYGEESVPMTIFVMGHVMPETSPSVARLLEVSYHRKDYLRGVPAEFRDALSEGALYTVVHLEAPSADLVDDLWFTPGRPVGVGYAELVLSLSQRPFVVIVFWVLMIAVLSYLSAGLSGLVLFGRWKGYARIGLWNLLTLGAVVIRARLLEGKRRDDPMNSRKSRVAFLLLFSACFVVGSYLLQLLLGMLLHL